MSSEKSGKTASSVKKMVLLAGAILLVGAAVFLLLRGEDETPQARPAPDASPTASPSKAPTKEELEAARRLAEQREGCVGAKEVLDTYFEKYQSGADVPADDRRDLGRAVKKAGENCPSFEEGRVFIEKTLTPWMLPGVGAGPGGPLDPNRPNQYPSETPAPQ